jgi:heme A synthase
MTANVGGVDRTVRLLIGVVLVLLGLFNVLTGVAAIIGYIVAALALITGLTRYCLLYPVFKINTAKKAVEKTA